jgi:hypothetical protein
VFTSDPALAWLLSEQVSSVAHVEQGYGYGYRDGAKPWVYVAFEVLTAVTLISRRYIFWNVMPSSLVEAGGFSQEHTADFLLRNEE